MAQSGEMGNCVTASGYARNASPGPAQQREGSPGEAASLRPHRPLGGTFLGHQLSTDQGRPTKGKVRNWTFPGVTQRVEMWESVRGTQSLHAGSLGSVLSSAWSPEHCQDA